MEEPQPLINPPMEIENQQESPQLIPEIQPQAEPEPLQPDNQPNEPNEPDNIVLDTVINQVESIQEEPKPELMETEPEPPKESLNLVEYPISPISVEKENILPDEPYTNEEIDKPEEIVELPQLEPIKSQNATSLDDIPDDLKDQEVKKSLIDEGDDVDYEEAIRELDELFNSGEDTTKDPITPPKENVEGEQEEKENDIKIKIRPGSKSQTIDFASQPSGSGSKKGKQSPVSVNGEKNSQQQRGRKKLTKLTESNPFMEEFEEHLDPTERLFKLTDEKKFKIPNKDLDIHELKQRYHNIIYNFRSESEVACLVCLDDESAPEDDIIICDLCSSAFHQSCYGSDLLNIAQDDDSEWHCQRCAFLLKNNLLPEGILCMFCPELKGPMKRVRNSNSHEWAHIVCVNWIPEIYYQEEREKANVYITEYKAKKHCGRKYLDCDFCHIGYGDCIDCDNDKCKRAFHVTCAQKHGLICNWKEMKDMKRDQDTEFYTPIYCKHHMQLYSQAMFDFSNKVEARNEGRGLEVSLMLDPATIAKSQPPKRSHKAKKRLTETEKSEEKEYDPDATISYSPDGEPSKRRSRRTRQQIEEEEERRAFKTRGRTAKKSVVSQDNETPDKMRESNLDNERKFEVEAHYEEKPRREHPGSKKEMDSSFISTGRVMTYTTMEEEEPESKKSTPVKTKKQSGGTVTEHKAEPKHNMTHKKEKTEKKEKKKEKMEHAEKSNKRDRPDKTAKEEQAEKKEHSGPALYKFRPNMAKLLMFNGWGTEKEIKTVISDYIKTKGLYRKDDEEIDVTRDKDLEDIMGLERISRKQIFNEFLHFMLKKTPEEIVRDDNDTPFISLYEEEYKKAKEKDRHGKENNKMQVEEKQGEQRIKKKPAFANTTRKEPVKEATRPLAQSQTAAKAKNTLTQNTASKPIERPFQQIFGKESMAMGWQPSTRDNVKPKPKPQEKESDLDFFEWVPKHNENKPAHQSNIAKPLHSSQPIQKSHVISVEEEKEPPILKRMKINTPPKTNSTVFSSLFANKESKEDRQNTNKEERHNTNKDERHNTPAQPAVVVRSKKNDPYEDLGPLINRVDKMPFRRNMNWFVKTDSSLAVSSINSQTARERFWPKGASQLF